MFHGKYNQLMRHKNTDAVHDCMTLFKENE